MLTSVPGDSSPSSPNAIIAPISSGDCSSDTTLAVSANGPKSLLNDLPVDDPSPLDLSSELSPTGIPTKMASPHASPAMLASPPARDLSKAQASPPLEDPDHLPLTPGIVAVLSRGNYPTLAAGLRDWAAVKEESVLIPFPTASLRWPPKGWRKWPAHSQDGSHE